MTNLHWWEYVAVFVGTSALTLVLTPLALRLALRTKVLDHPSGIKAQESAVPYLGGAAIAVAFALVTLVAAFIRPPESGLVELAVILGLASLLAVVGLVDDLKGLGPWVRLAVEAGAGVIVWATPAGAELTGNAGIDLVVTVLWVTAITNAFNLLDNMDGLSAGVAAIAAIALFVIAKENGQFLVAVLALALAGCAAGFLRSNFHPAKIYMGDAGALFLGFLLAVLSMKVQLVDAPREIAVFVPVLVLGIALFDTTLVTVNRIIHKRSPLMGGRDHVSHRLVFVGVSVPVSVALIYVGTVSLGCLAVVMARQDFGTGVLLMVWVGVVAGFLGVLLSYVPVYTTSRRRHLMLQEVERHQVEPDAHLAEEPPESAVS